jgi:hypothetical protein
MEEGGVLNCLTFSLQPQTSVFSLEPQPSVSEPIRRGAASPSGDSSPRSY